MNTLRSRVQSSWPVWLLAVMILGNLTSTRRFAHLGVSPVYIGEIALGTVLFWQFRIYAIRWIQPLVSRHVLSGVSWAILTSILFGFLHVLRGLLTHEASVAALSCFAFHLYPLFFFLGVEVGIRRPEFLRNFLRWFVWIHGFYGLAYILVFSPLGLVDTLETNIRLFSQPAGAAIAILGLLCFEGIGGRSLVPLLLNSFVLVGIQVRAEWLGFLASISIWSVLTRHVRQLAKLSAFVALFALVGLISDFKVAAPAGRGGEISVRGIVGRALAAVSPDLAGDLLDDPDRFNSTVSWRTEWWKEIVALTHETPQSAIFGLGYGYPIWDYHPEGVAAGLRTPHSILVFALGYTGWLGLAIYLILQLSLGRLLWRTFRATGQSFGLQVWILINIWASADNLLEAPYGAIPFYLLLGLAAAPITSLTSKDNEPVDARREE